MDFDDVAFKVAFIGWFDQGIEYRPTQARCALERIAKGVQA